MVRKRCAKGVKVCRNWMPCPKHPQGWLANTSRPLPANWAQLKKRMASRKASGCEVCGALRVPLELDHIVPRAQGGSDHLINLRWLCEPCHKVKTRADKKKGRP